MKQKVKFIKDFPSTTEFEYDEDLWYRQHGDAFVIINCHSSQIYYPEHWTPLSLKCAFNGKEFYKLKNTTYAVTEENFLIMNQGSRYASYILSDSLTESFTLNFTQHNLKVLSTANGRSGSQLLDDPFTLNNDSTNFIEKLYSYNPIITSYIQQLKKIISPQGADNAAVIELFYFILGEIYQLNCIAIKEADSIAARKKTTRHELYKRLSVAKDYIRSCYYQEITLEQLAANCYLNTFYLLREFKKFYHITPHQYLTKVRLHEAEKLILRSTMQIAHIAHEVGFEDASSFTRLFRKQYGASPYLYRNQGGFK